MKKRNLLVQAASAILVFVFMAFTGQLSAQDLHYGDIIHLQNGWNNYGGGYLDTRGYQKDFEKTGNFLCVSTATSKNRAGGSGIWKVIISKSSVKTKSVLKAGETLTVGKKLVSANNAYMAIMQTDGNFCVYKYVNGKQGAFVWCSMAHGFSNGKIIMQTDGNLVVYDASNKAKWSSQTHPAFDSKFRNSANKPVKLVLENDGKLVLYTASGAKMWTNK